MDIKKKFGDRIVRTVRNNTPLFIFFPLLVVVHWAWFRLQENELFVPREMNKGHPFLDGKFGERMQKLKDLVKRTDRRGESSSE